MKVAVVGCGGNGGVVAAALARNRHSPFCIEKGDIAGILNDRGLHLFGKLGKFHAQVRAFHGFSGEMGVFDVIFIGVKSNVLREVFREAKNHLCDNGFIVTIQNGLEVLSIAEEYPDTKIVAGAVGYNAQAEETVNIRVTARGGITFGTLNNASRDDLFLLKGLLEPLIPVDFADTTRGVLWTKLLIVCGTTGLGGVAGLRVGQLLRRRVARRLFYALCTEGALLAEKLGIRLVKLRGGINPEKFGNHRWWFPLPLRWLFLKLAGVKFRHLKSGIQVDLEKGKETEVDYINGAVVREGGCVGFDTPVNRMVVKMVREIEEERREMCPDNLLEMWSAVHGGERSG